MTDQKAREESCNFCKERRSGKFTSICSKCLNEFAKVVDAGKTTLSETCSFCCSLAPVPGSPLFEVVKKWGECICTSCIVAQKQLHQRNEEGKSAKLFQFPAPKDQNS
jgi:uncharacterized Zn finger protein (UPF0148 family)